MLNAKQYIAKLLEYRKAGRHDLIEQLARERCAQNKALKKRNQLSFDVVGEAAENEPRPTVTAPDR